MNHDTISGDLPLWAALILFIITLPIDIYIFISNKIEAINDNN